MHTLFIITCPQRTGSHKYGTGVLQEAGWLPVPGSNFSTLLSFSAWNTHSHNSMPGTWGAWLALKGYLKDPQVFTVDGEGPLGPVLRKSGHQSAPASETGGLLATALPRLGVVGLWVSLCWSFWWLPRWARAVSRVPAAPSGP